MSWDSSGRWWVRNPAPLGKALLDRIIQKHEAITRYPGREISPSNCRMSERFGYNGSGGERRLGHYVGLRNSKHEAIAYYFVSLTGRIRLDSEEPPEPTRPTSRFDRPEVLP